MRTKIYKWVTIDDVYYFDLYVDESCIYSLFKNGLKMAISGFPIDSTVIQVEEKEVPEDIRKIVKDYMADPFFEIELEKYICNQKS